MSPQAGTEQWRKLIPMMFDIRININISKEEFNNGTIPIFGSDTYAFLPPP
jgi:hypothetical protein